MQGNILINLAETPTQGSATGTGREGYLDRLIAAGGSLLVPVLYSALFSASQSPLVAVPLVLGAAAPVAGAAAAPLVTLALLYLDTPFIAYVLAPPLLLSLSRVFSSWRQVLVILLMPPAVLISPGLAPLILGAAVASFSSEDEIGSILSGLIATLDLYVAAALVLPSSVALAGLLELPGGIVSHLASATQVGMAGEFYVLLLQRVQGSPLLLAGLILVPASSLAAALIKDRYGAGYAAVAATAIMTLEAPLLPGGLGGALGSLIGFLASCGAVEVAAEYMRRRFTEGARNKPEPPPRPRLRPRPRPSTYTVSSPVERDIVEIVMYDLRDLAATVRRLAERRARIIIMGPRLEDEEMFADYAFGGSVPGNVSLSHMLGPKWYEEEKGYVAYVAPLDPEEIVDVVEAYCSVAGIQLGAEVLGILRDKVAGLSRYAVAKLIEAIKHRGCMGDAVIAVLSEVAPDIPPQFFIDYEHVQERLPVIGLKK